MAGFKLSLFLKDKQLYQISLLLLQLNKLNLNQKNPSINKNQSLKNKKSFDYKTEAFCLIGSGERHSELLIGVKQQKKNLMSL